MADRREVHEVVEQLPAEEEPIDAETAAKLDAARGEGGPPVPLEEVKSRHGL
jgi:hypothetical protein